MALTPAAFGARIKQLEEQFEVELFSRTTRVVVPTQAALALLPQARACLVAAEHCVRAARPAEVVRRSELAPRHGARWRRHLE